MVKSGIAINLGGEGECLGAVNVNIPAILREGWNMSRKEGGLKEVLASGPVVIAQGDRLPFPNGLIDRIVAKNVCFDGRSWLGPWYSSSEVKRVIKGKR